MGDTADQDGARAYYDHVVACPKCPDHPHPIVIVEEAAFLMGVSRRTLFRWLAGGSVAYSNKKIVRWLVENGDHIADLVTDNPAHVGETISRPATKEGRS
jgi:hypothetical protein